MRRFPVHDTAGNAVDHGASGGTNRMERRPFFMASVPAAERRMHDRSADALARLPGRSPDDVVRRAPGRRPIARSPTFLSALDHLARRFAIPGERAIPIIRDVDALPAPLLPDVAGIAGRRAR